jgi:hypothetical protein
MQIGSHNCFSIFTLCKLWLDSNPQTQHYQSIVQMDLVEQQQLDKVSINLTWILWILSYSMSNKSSRINAAGNPYWRGGSVQSGNTKGGSITVLLTSCLTGLESAVWQLTIFVFICKTDYSKPVKQEVNGTAILPHLVFPGTVDLLELTSTG